MDLSFRDAEQTDYPLLKRLAERFGRGRDDSHALRGWMNPIDAGIVAVAPSGEDVGAAWYREWVVDDAPGRAPHGAREVFVGVDEAHEGRGIARELMSRLVALAKDDRRVDTLIGYPVKERPEPTALLKGQSFLEPPDDTPWTLDVGPERRSPW